jgi:uncharacterized protein YqjF (DUF2071 family)
MTLDTFDGSAWLSVVAFGVTDFAPRLVPPLPWVSTFNEVNLRTYVLVEGRPGVYFFSLDASQPVVVRLARVAGLSYFDAEIVMSRSEESVFVQSVRRDPHGPPAAFASTYHPLEGRLRPTFGTLTSWLTDRYCAFSEKRGALIRAEIHHAPWILQPVRAEIHENSLFEAIGLELPDAPDLVHYARKQRAWFWPPIPTSGSRRERRRADRRAEAPRTPDTAPSDGRDRSAPTTWH